MGNLADLISAVPDAVWGAFVGGASAVTVVIVQLWHDRHLRRKEREFATRREIYLQAVEAIAAAQSVLFNFGRLDLPQQELTSPLQGYPGWLNKVQVVASDATLEAFREVGEYFVAAAFDLFKARLELEQIASQVKNLEERREQISSFQAYLLSIARGTTPRPSTGLDDLGAAVLATKQQLDTVLNELDRLVEQRLRLNVDLVRLCADHGGGFPRVAVPVIVAIRREVDMPIDETRYRDGVERSSTKLRGQLEQLITELDRRYGPQGGESR